MYGSKTALRHYSLILGIFRTNWTKKYKKWKSMNPAVRNLRRIGCPLVESSQHCSKKKYSFHKYFIPTNKFSYRRVPSNVMSVPTTWKWSRKQVFWGVREVSKKYQTMLLRNAQAPQKHKLQQGCFQWLWQKRKQWKLPEKGKTAKCELYCIKHINQAVSRFSYAELVAKLHIFLSFLLSHSPFFCSLSRAPTLSIFFCVLLLPLCRVQ